MPGSGKTTLAEFLYAQLTQQGESVQCLLEGTQPHPLYTAASPYTPEPFAQGILQVWQAHVAQTSQSGIITVAEGILYQNAIRLLMQNGMEVQRIIEYADAIEVVISPLHPILIYLSQADIPRAVERICQKRGAKFQAYLVRALTENTFAQQLGLTGIEGAIAFLQNYSALCDTLVAKTSLTKLVMEVSGCEWLRYYERAMEFLNLSKRA